LADLFERNRIIIGLGINIRIDSYCKDMAEVFHRLGVDTISFGFETGSNRLLRQIKNNQYMSVEKEYV
jgi:radical SAM superfamily enzyme YgiQ (UPF0313 family)